MDMQETLNQARTDLVAAREHVQGHAAEELLTAALIKLDRARASAPSQDDSRLVRVLMDLDRCPHGRREGDPCGPTGQCDGTSAGNPHIRPGQVIGYDRGCSPLVMPSRDNKYKPRAWRA